MSDNEDPDQLLAETASLLSADSKSKLQKTLGVLSAAPPKSPSFDKVEAFILKKRRKQAGWKQFSAETSGDSIVYFRPKSKLVPVGNLLVSYVSPLVKFTEEEQSTFAKGDADVTAKKYFYCFSDQRMDRLSAKNADELKAWHTALRAGVAKAWGSEDAIKTKDETFEEFKKALDEATTASKKNGLTVVAALSSQGFVNRTKDGLVYQGHLFFQKEKADKTPGAEGNYMIVTKKYFAYLYSSGDLVYTKHSKDPVPKGVINVAGAEVTYETDRPDEDDSDPACTFTLKTRLHTFTLKARHRVALTEWVKAISDAQTAAANGGTAVAVAAKVASAKKAVSGNKVEPYGEGLVGALVYRLEPGKKEKVFTLSAGDQVAGRSSACKLQLDNKQVSRNHARIEYDSTGARLVDLGSAHGTFVNGKKTNKAELKDGDEVSFGDPSKGQTLRFEVRKKGMLSKLLGK
jgi:hypothetical protein